MDLKSDDADSSLRLTASQGSWFSSLLAVGALLGGPIGGWSIDKYGRKGTILLCAIFFEFGWLLIILAQNHAMLYAGRIVTGLACGMISLAVPVYVAEIVPARLRGSLGSIFSLAICAGQLLAYLVGAFCHWKMSALYGAVPPALLVVLMYAMPETPRWALMKNRRLEAIELLLWLRGPDVDIEKECLSIESTFECQEKLSFREWLSPALAKPLLISVGLKFFQQFGGNSVVLFNAAGIFMVAGFKNGKLVSISVGLIRLLGGALACLIMDKAGRRIPLLTMAIGMCISLLLLGFYFEIYIPPPESSSSSNTVSLLRSISHSIPASKINWLSIVCVILFNLFFCLAWGPVPWLVMSELFPMRARGPAVCMTAMANWLFIFIVTKLYDPMQSSISIQGTFWFYGGCMFLAFVFVYKLVPETKGKTLEEIESLFKPHKNSYMPIG